MSLLRTIDNFHLLSFRLSIFQCRKYHFQVEMPLYTFGGATGSSDERSNSRETSNGDDEEDGCGYENNAGSHEDEREEYDEENDEEECFSKKTNRFSPMIVYVETLTGTAFEVRVSQYEAVMSIKDKIQRLEGS